MEQDNIDLTFEAEQDNIDLTFEAEQDNIDLRIINSARRSLSTRGQNHRHDCSVPTMDTVR